MDGSSHSEHEDWTNQNRRGCGPSIEDRSDWIVLESPRSTGAVGNAWVGYSC